MASFVIALAGSAVGASIGGSFMGLSAASIGWMLGSAVGGYMFAPDAPNVQHEGPRLDDLKVGGSSYGNPIPKTFATYRVAGNMIWSRPIQETRHETTTSSGGGGGKGGGGGGGGSVTQVSYTYSQTFAVGICVGVIAGIRKIWANGELIYNFSDDINLSTLVASVSDASGITIYAGDETQLPNATIQAVEGADYTPAYRGTAYVVLENLQLEKYGNRTPNLEFEVVTAGSPTSDYVGPAWSSGLDMYSRYSYISQGVHYGWVDQTLISGTAYRQQVAKQNINTAAILGRDYWTSPYYLQSPFYDDPYSGIAYDPVEGTKFHVIKNGVILSTYNMAEVPTGSGYADRATAWGTPDAGVFIGIIGYRLMAYSIRGGTVVAQKDFGSYGLDWAGGGWWPFAVGDDGLLYQVQALTINAYDQFFNLVGSWAGTYPTENEAGSAGIWKASIIDNELCYDIANDWVTGWANRILRLNSDGTSESVSYLTGAGLFHTLLTKRTRLSAEAPMIGDSSLNASSVSVGYAVSELCQMSGLQAADVDVTLLTASLKGYAVTRGTIRGHIQPLMQAFFFDAVESDGKIKFVPRGLHTGITITEDDLSAHEGGHELPEPFLYERAQDMELPQEVVVSFPDSDNHYLTSTQIGRRLIANGVNSQSLNLAVAMTPTQGKQIADVMLFDAWTARTSGDISTSWKYAYLEPTDVVTLQIRGRSYDVRITEEDIVFGAISRKAVFDDSEVYIQAAVAASSLSPDDTVDVVPPTTLVLMDIPLLRDADDEVGFYAAAAGVGDPADWKGCQLYKSSDAGRSWFPAGVGILNAAVIGTATTVLANFTLNVFDEANTVTITLETGDLESSTYESVLNGANAALLGNEIIQFRDAVLVSANTYTLSGLLRGRKGTEWAASQHVAGERFVLLSSLTTYILYGPSTEYDLIRKYRAATFGSFLSDSIDQDFTNTAVAQIPYAPVQLGGGRTTGGAVILNWVRRTRIGGGWNGFADVPLGEDTEAYELDIYTDNTYTTVIRAVTGLTTSTYTYSSADQVTDFGANQSTVYWRVYQISALVGRGYQATGAT